MKRNTIWSSIFLVFVLLFLYIPILVVIVYSFNDNLSRIPLSFDGFTLHWYEMLFSGQGGFDNALWLSIQVALYSVLLACLLGTFGALGIAHKTLYHNKKISKPDAILETILTLPIMIPEIILGVAFMIIFNSLGIKGNVLRLVFAHTTFCIPYLYLNVKSRLMGMDRALFDAARDLGASPFDVMRDITLPLCKPAIISGAFLAFAMSMDDFVISFFVYGVGEGTLPLKIYSSVKAGVSLQVNALCTLMIVVIFFSLALNQWVGAKKKKHAIANAT